MSAPPVPVALARIPEGSAFEAAARACLGPLERGRHDAIRHTRRRREWLAGRILAKMLLEGLPAPTPDAPTWAIPFRSGWQVIPDPEGAPEAFMEEGGEPKGLSISHAGGWLLVALGDPVPVGVDVEVIASDPLGVVRGADDAAALWIETAAPRDRPRLGALCWSLKEAAAKAGRFGRPDVSSIAGVPVLPSVTVEQALMACRGADQWSPLPIRIAQGVAETAYVRAAGRTAVASLVLGRERIAPSDP